MNNFTTWCYRIGLVAGILMLVSGYALIPDELGLPLPGAMRRLAEHVFSVAAPVFMGLGFVLLAAAIMWLSRTWSNLSQPTKVASVLGLLVGTFAGAYVFHWLFPKVLGSKSSA